MISVVQILSRLITLLPRDGWCSDTFSAYNPITPWWVVLRYFLGLKPCYPVVDGVQIFSRHITLFIICRLTSNLLNSLFTGNFSAEHNNSILFHFLFKIVRGTILSPWSEFDVLVKQIATMSSAVSKKHNSFLSVFWVISLSLSL